MSRWIDVCEEYQTVHESIASMDECREMCNDVCCNDMSDQCGCFVDPEYCKTGCTHFVKEDGIIYE